MRLLQDLTFRTIATIVLKVSSTGGGLALLGAERWLALAGAVWVGVLEVSEEAAKAYLDDGVISKRDLNAMSKRIIERHEEAKKK
jgi:hypothetical protein